MRLSHPDYTKLVFRTYQALRSNPEFSPALRQPTPASIRKECLTVYKERPDKKDDPALRSFFGAAENSSFLNPIENFPTEGFRAFSNYLKGKSANTDDKNVGLLAWLIDFPHRPFRSGMNVILSEAEIAILISKEEANLPQGPDPNFPDEIQSDYLNNSPDLVRQPLRNEKEVNVLSNTNEELPDAQGNQHNDIVNTDRSGWILPGENEIQKKRKWLIIGVSLFILILSSGVYLLYDNDKNCMYWTGDHYERIDCDAAINDKVVFNEERWKNFRKITDLSTISEKSIGVVHYYGNKNREFYTSGGKHPVETTRYLKVLTRYIWEKEFGPKDSVAISTSFDETKKPVVK